MKSPHLLPLLIASLLLSACSGPLLPDLSRIEQGAEQAALEQMMTVRDVRSRKNAAILEAQNLRLDLFAPHHFEKIEAANGALDAAIPSDSEGADIVPPDINRHLLLLEGYVADARKQRDQIEARFSRMSANYLALASHDAEAYYPDEFAAIRKKIDRLIERRGVLDPRKALKRSERLADRLYALEIRVVTVATLQPAEELLARLRKTDRDEYAPRTVKEAENTIRDGRKVIAEMPRDRAAVRQVGETTLSNARHAEQVAHSVHAVMKLGKGKSAEAFVRDLESWLVAISGIVPKEEIWHLPLSEQAALLSERQRLWREEKERDLESAQLELGATVAASREQIADYPELKQQLASSQAELKKTRRELSNQRRAARLLREQIRIFKAEQQGLLP